MQLPYEHSGFGRNYSKLWIATEKSGKTHPTVGDSLCDQTHPENHVTSSHRWFGNPRPLCSTESNPSIGGSNDSDPNFCLQKVWRKPPPGVSKPKTPPSTREIPDFHPFFLVFRKANQGTPARICTKTFPTLIGRNPLVVVLEQVRFKRDVNWAKKPGPTFHGILVGSWRDPFVHGLWNNPYVTG